MKRIRLGQIGIGHNHGEAKMRTARKFPELFEIVGYAEDDEKWVEKRGNSEGYKGLTRMSVEQIIKKSDAILVESDVWDLTKYAKMCVDAGKHIHIDKPASGTLEEYRAVLDTAKEKKLVVQLGYMYRYNPTVRKCFEMIKNGELGEIYSVNAEMSTGHSDGYRDWLNNFHGGNMSIFGSHLVDLTVSLLGEPKSVLSSICHSNKNGVNAPDLSTAILQYENAVARIFVSSVELNGWGRRCFSVSGSKATVEIRPLEVPVRMTVAKKGTGNEYFEDYAREVDAPFLPDNERYDEMLRDFYQFIVGGKENPYTYEHEYTVQRTLLKITGGKI